MGRGRGGLGGRRWWRHTGLRATGCSWLRSMSRTARRRLATWNGWRRSRRTGRRSARRQSGNREAVDTDGTAQREAFRRWLPGSNWISNRAEERGRMSVQIEFANKSIDNLLRTVETQRATVSELAGTVANVRPTVQNLRDAVETQRATVSELAGAVVNVRATAEGVRDAVESIEGTVDALDETIPLLVSCVIDLNRTQGACPGLRDSGQRPLENRLTAPSAGGAGCGCAGRSACRPSRRRRS